MRGKGAFVSRCINVVLFLGLACGCGAGYTKPPTGVATQGLKLKRAVLYQNGIGYFERRGKIAGDRLTIRIRADQVNDFLKSLTVIDQSKGQAVSVSLPLDRNAAKEVMALANQLKEGITLPELIESLKGTQVTLLGKKGSAAGRILSADEVEGEETVDWRVSLMGKTAIQTMMLSDVETVYVADAFIVLGLHKGLDAAASGGVFKVVDVTVHLDHDGQHDLMVSYVVACPAWKPSYRLVVGEKNEVLLQGWAVVDNVTGEAWEQVALSLTSGAPLAFQYDLYAPRFVERPDLSHVASQKSARAKVGETSYGETADEEAEEEPASYAVDEMAAEAPKEMLPEPQVGGRRDAADNKKRLRKARAKAAGTVSKSSMGFSQEGSRHMGPAMAAPSPEPAPSQIDIDTLQQSARSMVKAQRASGAVRYDLQGPVSVPDRSATLVSIINHRVPGEEAFLFTPGGAGVGYEQNPYRVVRFKNTTGFILEPGPISIYSGGTFVGEGIGESISDNKQATIPFAVEPDVLVTSVREQKREGIKLLKIVRGLMTIESFDRIKTTYRVKGGERPFRIYVRHAKAGGPYLIKDAPADLEDLGEAVLLPIDVKSGDKETQFIAVEQTPITRSVTIWDYDGFAALELMLEGADALPLEQKKRLEEILAKRKKIASIDSSLSHLQKQKRELDERMYQTRENLKALKKNKAAGALKGRLAKKLEQYAKEADQKAKEIVSLTDERQELKVVVEEMIAELSFEK